MEVKSQVCLLFLLGDHSELEPPDTIPNSVVKRFSADGSVGSPHVRVGHRQAPIERIPDWKQSGIFAVWGLGSTLGRILIRHINVTSGGGHFRGCPYSG